MLSKLKIGPSAEGCSRFESRALRAGSSLPNSKILSVVGCFGCVFLLQSFAFPEGVHKQSGIEVGEACGSIGFGLSGMTRDGVGSGVEFGWPTGIAAPKYENLNPLPVIGIGDDA